MRRWSIVLLSFLLLGAVAPSHAAAQSASGGLVLELRQVTAAHEQSPVRYEAVIRNEGTEPAGWGQLYLDVPNDFAWALQYDPMLCFHYESEDLDCEVFALPPGEQVVYAFDYVVQAPPGDYQVTATYNPFRDPVPQAPMTSSVTTSVGPSAELQVAWSQLRSGADLVRRATVRSFGPSIATGVALTLTWQASRGTSVPASVTSSQGSCDPPTATSTQCALGEFSPFGTATVDLRFRGRGPQGLTTTAEVTSLTFDQDLSTNTATLST